MTNADHLRATSPVASVIIPAHNEQSVIARCLQTLFADAEPGEFEVIVVANGCIDQTAEIARQTATECAVVELAEASKVLALNVGDEAATSFPRVYLDADIEVDARSLRAVAQALERGSVMCAAPSMELNFDGRPWFIRAFFRGFQQLPYLSDELVGNGLYALNEEGRARFGTFPDITADDLFIRNLFTATERKTVPDGTFVVHPPRSFKGLLAIRERSYRGNDEYERLGYRSMAEPTRDRRRTIAALRRHPLDMTVFVLVNLLAKLRLRFRRRTTHWERDDSGRQ